jgi:SAM-dependent methyltransferase
MLMLIFYLWIFLLILIWGALLFYIYFVIIQTSFLSDAPFVPADASVVDKLVSHIPLEKGQKFYDLGCGDARILLAAYQRQPEMEYIGVEKNLYPYLRARLKLWRMGNPKNIKILKANIFDLNYSDADIIYLYLFPKVLERLQTQFTSELKPGSQVFSVTFKFPDKHPIAKIDFEKVHGWDIIKKMYIYKF